MSQIGQFYLWRFLPDGERLRAGALGVEQGDDQRLLGVEFAYTLTYLEHSQAVALDPRHAPLTQSTQRYTTRGHALPGFLDDCLPDAWGRRILAAHLKMRHVDTLSLLRGPIGATIGACVIADAAGDPPQLHNGIDLSIAQTLAPKLWSGDVAEVAEDPGLMSLLVMAGSSPGGARPKLLIEHEGRHWIAKFNTQQDVFNVVAAEWASLAVAKAAGIDVPEARIADIGGQPALLVERFDCSPHGGRYHLLSANALLKDPHTQDDAHAARYEDIADVIRRYSTKPAQDMDQLLRQALLNAALRNTDDHLRNFSFIHRGESWRLTPAYDVVPSAGVGAYHALSLGGSPSLMLPPKAREAAKALGLSTQAGDQAGAAVIAAMEKWPQLLAEAGLSGTWLDRLAGLVDRARG